MYNVSVTSNSLPKAHIPLVLFLTICIVFITHHVIVAQLFLPEVRGKVCIHAGPPYFVPSPSGTGHISLLSPYPSPLLLYIALVLHSSLNPFNSLFTQSSHLSRLLFLRSSTVNASASAHVCDAKILYTMLTPSLLIWDPIKE